MATLTAQFISERSNASNFHQNTLQTLNTIKNTCRNRRNELIFQNDATARVSGTSIFARQEHTEARTPAPDCSDRHFMQRSKRPLKNTSSTPCSPTSDSLNHQYLHRHHATLIKELLTTNLESAPTRSQTLIHDLNFPDIGEKVCRKDLILNKKHDLPPLYRGQLQINSVGHQSSCFEIQNYGHDKFALSSRGTSVIKLKLAKPPSNCCLDTSTTAVSSQPTNLSYSIECSTCTADVDSPDNVEPSTQNSTTHDHLREHHQGDLQQHWRSHSSLPEKLPSLLLSLPHNTPTSSPVMHAGAVSLTKMMGRRSELVFSLVSRVWLTALVLLTSTFVPGKQPLAYIFCIAHQHLRTR